MDPVDTGTTAFMLCCIIGLTLMIPGLALFYGGMVSVKSSTNMMMMTFGSVAIVGVLWVLFGFSMVFGTASALFGRNGEQDFPKKELYMPPQQNVFTSVRTWLFEQLLVTVKFEALVWRFAQ